MQLLRGGMYSIFIYTHYQYITNNFIYSIDSLGVSYRAMFISNWVLLASSLIIAAPIIWKKIKDITDIMKDLKFSDEDLEEVSTAAAMELRGR